LTQIFIDTSFVVALINERDQYHVQATELAALYERARFLITDIILLEIGNALATRYRHEAAAIIRTFSPLKMWKWFD